MESVPFKRSILVYGFGVNATDYVTQKFSNFNGKKKKAWTCPYYEDWRHMLKRCYSKTFQKERPMYIGCTVSEEWKYFSNFKRWVDEQPNRDWESCDLDKDILVCGNRVYGPETCVYVSKQINILFRNENVRDLPTGVYMKNGRFASSCHNVFTGKLEHLGYFDTVEAAEKYFLQHRLTMFEKLALTQEDPRVVEAIRNKYLPKETAEMIDYD
jgi:hypothetical protein